MKVHQKLSSVDIPLDSLATPKMSSVKNMISISENSFSHEHDLGSDCYTTHDRFSICSRECNTTVGLVVFAWIKNDWHINRVSECIHAKVLEILFWRARSFNLFLNKNNIRLWNGFHVQFPQASINLWWVPLHSFKKRKSFNVMQTYIQIKCLWVKWFHQKYRGGKDNCSSISEDIVAYQYSDLEYIKFPMDGAAFTNAKSMYWWKFDSCESLSQNPFDGHNLFSTQMKCRCKYDCRIISENIALIHKHFSLNSNTPWSIISA